MSISPDTVHDILTSAKVYVDEFPGEPLDPEWSAAAYEIDGIEDLDWTAYHDAVSLAISRMGPMSNPTAMWTMVRGAYMGWSPMGFILTAGPGWAYGSLGLVRVLCASCGAMLSLGAEERSGLCVICSSEPDVPSLARATKMMDWYRKGDGA